MSVDMNCKKDLHELEFVFPQVEFLCVGSNEATQQAHKSGLRKRGKAFIIQDNEVSFLFQSKKNSSPWQINEE
jgi:hypothetical protein